MATVIGDRSGRNFGNYVFNRRAAQNRRTLRRGFRLSCLLIRNSLNDKGNTSMPKVIEQWFDGIQFRSKTEARWAAFFKACGIRYEYEKEGYDLGGVICYLPDFWLPDLNRWFEVKGKEPSQEELEKCSALAIETGSEVLLAAGSPDPDVEQIIRVYPGFDWVVADKDWRDHRLKTWRAVGPTDVWEYGWQFADDHLQDGIFWVDSSEFGADCIGPNKAGRTDHHPSIARSATGRGFKIARRTRFVDYAARSPNLPSMG